MHNSFLACVLSYHNLQPENTYFYFFFHSEIIWPKVYLIPLLPQERKSLVKGWVVCVFEIWMFPFTTQLHRFEQLCPLPGAWSHSPAAAHEHRGRPGLDFSTRPSLRSSALATDPLLLQGNPVKHRQNGEPPLCQEMESMQTRGPQRRAMSTLRRCALELIYGWKALLVQIVHKAYDLSTCPQGHNNIYVA